jgi:hypothetical protein
VSSITRLLQTWQVKDRKQRPESYRGRSFLRRHDTSPVPCQTHPVKRLACARNSAQIIDLQRPTVADRLSCWIGTAGNSLACPPWFPSGRRFAQNLIVRFAEPRFWIVSKLPTTRVIGGQSSLCPLPRIQVNSTRFQTATPLPK